MSSRALPALVLVLLSGCPGGGGSVGDSCSNASDCDGPLQCVEHVCAPRCQRAPECGDGYACDADGLCRAATGEVGDACESEVECGSGLSCQIDGTTATGSGKLPTSCSAQYPGRPAGSECSVDTQCRNGTCALGHCVDLCTDTRDCGSGDACMSIPRIEANGVMFRGCLPARGTIEWTIPVIGPRSDILFPIPDAARSALLVFRVDDVAQKVGALRVDEPNGDPLAPIYKKPCHRSSPTDTTCDDVVAIEQYFAQSVRHLPEAGQSELLLPSTPSTPLIPGAYKVKVSSFRANDSAGSAIPRVTAVLKMDSAVTLDLHFYFLDLDDHPCDAAFGSRRLDAAAAKDATFFQSDFVGELRTVFSGGGLAIGATTYQDLTDHPDLDGLTIDDAGALLSLGAHETGINVFFVRTLSPVGLQAFGPNPGPAGVAGTRQSGVIISVDTLCYRSWSQLARLTAHELSRYMGLYHNVELEVAQHPSWRDPIDDSDASSRNLMFFSELGGIELSPGQREILSKSAVLR